MTQQLLPSFDFNKLLAILSRPRPNGSKALKETCVSLCNWLSINEISYKLHSYKARPYLMETMGAWLLISQLLLDVSVWLRWGWPSLLIVLIGLAVMQLEAKGVPVVSWIGNSRSENIIVTFSPLQSPQQEVVLSAHYDSKTELYDHNRRAFFLKRMPLAAGLSFLLGVLGVIDGFLRQSFDIVFWAGVALSIPHLIFMWGLGVNFLFGRLARPSQGSVDNGAACTILLDLANRLAKDDFSLQRTTVTVALFTGEEVAAQGSTAYVSDREWILPSIALNLELCGQNGPYIAWEQYGGSSASLYQATKPLNEAVEASVTCFDREFELVEGPVGTDSVPFLAAGIAATSLGTMDRDLGIGGLHRSTDNLERVVVDRLSETADIVANILTQYDNGSFLGK